MSSAEIEEKYKFLFNNGNDAIFYHELDGKFIEVNDVACRNLGYSRDELLSMSVADIDQPCSHNPKFVEILFAKGYMVGEVVHRRKDGSLIPVELSTRLIDINNKRMILSIARDIRERKKAEENEKHYLEELESLYREAKENSMKMEAINNIIRVINASLDFKKVVNTFAEETCKLFEFKEMVISLREEKEVTLLEKHRIICNGAQPIEKEPSHKIHINTEPYATIYRTGQPLINPAKREIEGMNSCIIIPINYEGYIVGTYSLNSIEKNKYAKVDLSFLLSLAEHLGVALQNARLYKKVQDLAVVMERNRLAQEIHDSTLQILGYFRAKGELLEKMLEKNSYQACLNISKEIQEVAVEAYNDTREAIHALSEQIDNRQRFEDVISDYVRKFGQRWKMKMNFEILSPLPDFERDIELQLLRVVQEALVNVRKHSGALLIHILMHQVEAGYAIDIEDNGIGFDFKEISRNSFGLKVMNERMTSIGGHLELTSEKGKGTMVRAWVPLRR